jgi:hypothetical protein
MNRLILLTPLLLACGIGQDPYARSFADAYCELLDDCQLLHNFGGELGSCLEAMEQMKLAESTAADCSYDGVAARICVNEVEGWDCDDIYEGVASACDDVCGATATD